MIEQFRKRLETYQPQLLGETQSYAVLLPLVKVANEWHVLYEVRGEYISQPGEVSFPGGKIEVGETAQEAVIREVEEELGISKEQVKLLGEIDYVILGNTTIRCFVGTVDVDWTCLLPNDEVARWFTVPLKHLLELEPRYYSLSISLAADQDFPFDRIRGGRQYSFRYPERLIPFYETLSENIWGLTAQFTHRFTEMINEMPI